MTGPLRHLLSGLNAWGRLAPGSRPHRFAVTLLDRLRREASQRPHFRAAARRLAQSIPGATALVRDLSPQQALSDTPSGDARTLLLPISDHARNIELLLIQMIESSKKGF
ncbi:hypothetical protein DYH55_00815 [Methylovirgula sp. 4M-Z18]|nr:hypothetical protein DYH55_00815 [Methylovirgula sp. 4M-Z18]